MTEMLSFFATLSPAEQFQTGAALFAALFVLVLAAIICGPSLLASARLAHRELFPPLEDDEARLVEAKQRARAELRLVASRKVPHQVDADDERALLNAIVSMSSPSNRVH